MGVEELPDDISDSEAIAMARILFEERRAEYDGFEVWDRDRAVYAFPEATKASA